MLPQYIIGAAVVGIAANLYSDDDQLALRHPAVKRMALDTVQWGEETARELFVKATASFDAPVEGARVRLNKWGLLSSHPHVEPAAPAAVVDVSPPCTAVFTEPLDVSPPRTSVFTEPLDDPSLQLEAIVARDDVCIASVLDHFFTSTPDDEPAPEPIVSIRDGGCMFGPNIGVSRDTAVFEPAACSIVESSSGWNAVFGDQSTLDGLAGGFTLGFTVVALVVGILMAGFLNALMRKRDRRSSKREIKARRRHGQRATTRNATKATKEERKVAMNAQSSTVLLRTHVSPAVSLHRSDAGLPLHSVVRADVVHPPVNTGPPDIDLINFDATVEVGPPGHALTLVDFPPFKFPSHVVTAPRIDEFFGLDSAANSGFVLTAPTEYGGADADFSGLDPSFTNEANFAPVFAVATSPSDVIEPQASAILDAALAAPDSSSALCGQAADARVTVDTLLDLFSVQGNVVADVPLLLTEAVLPPVASIASG